MLKHRTLMCIETPAGNLCVWTDEVDWIKLLSSLSVYHITLEVFV